MKVFLEIPEDLMANGCDRAVLISNLSEHIVSEFQSMLDAGDDVPLGEIMASAYVFGTDSPEEIRKAAGAWNDDLRKRAMDAIHAITTTDAMLPIDTQETYQLKLAALALDNCFYPFADQLVIVESELGCTGMQPVLPEPMAQQAMEHPEWFCTVEVYPVS